MGAGVDKSYSGSQWLDPHVISSLESLEFLATQVVEGTITGLHTSPFHGYNQEFAEHRPYQSGDEIRHLDWKLLGRTDRLYIKQFEADTNLRATLVLDASGSMDFSGQDQPHIEGARSSRHTGLTKYDYARRLAACLAYLLIRQRDATGLAIIDQAIRAYIPARGSGSHLRNILEALDGATPGGETSLAVNLSNLAAQIQRRGLILLISDLIDNPDEVIESLKLLRHRKHEVIVFHLMDRQEWDLEYEGGIRFRDPEGSETIDSDPVRLRAGYKKMIEDVCSRYRDGCLEHGIGYEWVFTDTPLERLILSFLAKRNGVRRQ
ncbi:MAG: hypothetical protein AMXMBFR75_05910 [Candidatus Hinthialibacteria bacterium]|nr:MAG: hypothetical protein UZ16_OP3001001267 [Candidatus Hinthialibacteria bacterium OLB16]